MPHTCLIAASDPWFIQLLRVYTEESGFRTVQANQSQDVLPLISQEEPAVILLQMDLPGQIKGMEVLQSIKANPSTSHIPILVFSWQGPEKVENLFGGLAAHLQEPVTYEAFVDALNHVGLPAVEHRSNGNSSRKFLANQAASPIEAKGPKKRGKNK
ncbi:MAG: response regulator [Omnitrophica WOR_2 bacterium]